MIIHIVHNWFKAILLYDVYCFQNGQTVVVVVGHVTWKWKMD